MTTRFVESFADLAGDAESAVAIGYFDGVHVGHQALVQRMIEVARERDLRSVILTFAEHPATVLRPEAVPQLITSREHRIELLSTLGAEVLCVAPFDRALSQWTPRRFCEEVLRDFARTRALIVGRNFVLGRERSGSVSVLCELGDELGFEVMPFDSVRRANAVVSSSEVRRLASEGQVERVAEFLGRSFAVTGRRVAGNRLGREIGFPTVNLRVPEELLLPGPGIYAGRARIGEQTLGAAVYLGTKSTVGGSVLSFEVHLLDFSGTVRESEVTVEFVARIRGDTRFDSLKELTQQIGRDVAEASQLLGGS